MTARPRTNETALSRSIRMALERLGYWVERIQSGQVPALYSGKVRYIHCASPGTPDLLVIDAVPTWLEVKLPGAKLRPQQADWHRRAANKGVRVATVRSVADALRAVRGTDG
jgi:hypothetical protein